MTFTRAELAAPIRYIAEYEDGSKHVFQVPQSTLEQGLPSEGRYSIACIVAYEWQQDAWKNCAGVPRQLIAAPQWLSCMSFVFKGEFEPGTISLNLAIADNQVLLDHFGYTQLA